jgi:iron complex outermembrane receptor protein
MSSSLLKAAPLRGGAAVSALVFSLAMSPGASWAQTADGDEIVITAQRTSDETGVGMLGDRGVMETPLSVTGYTAAMIQDQGARSTSEVLANDPSVRVQSAGDGVYDYFSIRRLRFFA